MADGLQGGVGVDIAGSTPSCLGTMNTMTAGKKKKFQFVSLSSSMPRFSTHSFSFRVQWPSCLTFRVIPVCQNRDSQIFILLTIVPFPACISKILFPCSLSRRLSERSFYSLRRFLLAGDAQSPTFPTKALNSFRLETAPSNPSDRSVCLGVFFAWISDGQILNFLICAFSRLITVTRVSKRSKVNEDEVVTPDQPEQDMRMNTSLEANQISKPPPRERTPSAVGAGDSPLASIQALLRLILIPRSITGRPSLILGNMDGDGLPLC